MLMQGNNIQSPADLLQKVKDEVLYYSLVNPQHHVASTIKQLRTVYAIDTTRYACLKRMLPYVVCGMFNPPYRRKENFAYTERFVLDFDHLTAKNLRIDELRKKLSADSRVMMCFASPSEDGLKVMFRLKERCYDSGVYSIFYKAFAASFARQLGLEQVLDPRTSDVSRACFLSVDPKAYYNAQAEAIDLAAFVNTDNPLATYDLLRRQDKPEKEQKAVPQQPKPSPDLSKDLMDRIRATLRPKAPVVKKATYVPTQLDDIIDPLCEAIRQTGIEVTEVCNIQYAKKIRTRLGSRQGELNVFYGKRGYSVVESPRRGTDDELNHLLADVVKAFLADSGKLPY